MREKENIIFGIHPILEAIKIGKEFEKIFLQNDLQGNLAHELMSEIKKNNIVISYVPIQKLNKLTQNNNHQGVVGIISSIKTYDIEEILENLNQQNKTPFLLMLDKITDVRNFGAICRTALCAGVDAIIIPKRESAQINADAIKTSAGALLKIPVCKVDNLTDTAYLLKDNLIKLVACTEKANKLIYDINYDYPLTIIMGNEEKGISKQLLNLSEDKVKIPLLGDIGSLNVSVAAAIIMYEAVKKRLG